jgi:hypothetical protein
MFNVRKLKIDSLLHRKLNIDSLLHRKLNIDSLLHRKLNIDSLLHRKMLLCTSVVHLCHVITAHTSRLEPLLHVVRSLID